MNHIYPHSNTNINDINNCNNLFRDFDDEIYTIKDSNQKKINDIIRDVQNRKYVDKIHLNKEKKEHLKKLIDSTKEATDLYYNIFDIKNIRQKYKDQKENKYQDFKKFLQKSLKKEFKQKIIDSALQKNLKLLKQENKELKEKAKLLQKEGNKEDNKEENKNIIELSGKDEAK